MCFSSGNGTKKDNYKKIFFLLFKTFQKKIDCLNKQKNNNVL